MAFHGALDGREGGAHGCFSPHEVHKFPHHAHVAAAMAGLTRPERCTVIMDGGQLDVSWDPVTREIQMTGTATTVFEGTIEMQED